MSFKALPGQNPGPRESEILAACLRWLSLRGVLCWRNNNAGVRRRDRNGREFWSFTGEPGVGDIIGILPGTGIHFEVEAKRPGGKVSEAQQAHGDRVRREGGLYFVAHTLDELIEQIEEVLNP